MGILQDLWGGIQHEASRAGFQLSRGVNAIENQFGGGVKTNPDDYDMYGVKKKQPKPIPTHPGGLAPIGGNYDGHLVSGYQPGSTQQLADTVYNLNPGKLADTLPGPKHSTAAQSSPAIPTVPNISTPQGAGADVKTSSGMPAGHGNTPATPLRLADYTPDPQIMSDIAAMRQRINSSTARYTPGTPEYQQAQQAMQANLAHGLTNARAAIEQGGAGGFIGGAAKAGALASMGRNYQLDRQNATDQFNREAFDRTTAADNALLGLDRFQQEAQMGPLQRQLVQQQIDAYNRAVDNQNWELAGQIMQGLGTLGAGLVQAGVIAL